MLVMFSTGEQSKYLNLELLMVTRSWSVFVLRLNKIFMGLCSGCPGAHIECGRIDRIGRKGGQFPLKRINRFDQSIKRHVTFYQNKFKCGLKIGLTRRQIIILLDKKRRERRRKVEAVKTKRARGRQLYTERKGKGEYFSLIKEMRILMKCCFTNNS